MKFVFMRLLCTSEKLAQHRYKYIHMEEMLGNVPGARQIYERWMSFEPDHHGWMSFIKVLQCSRARLVPQSKQIDSSPRGPCRRRALHGVEQP